MAPLALRLSLRHSLSPKLVFLFFWKAQRHMHERGLAQIRNNCCGQKKEQARDSTMWKQPH
uniref:Uncharacterized protein n=1 Tax=Oreochromis aureus TaxID=47969 RepID=A0A668SY80_OREAU